MSSLNLFPRTFSLDNRGTGGRLIAFDIETGPLASDFLESLVPEFDPAEVKLGNIKDPALVAAKVEAARAKHRSDFVEKAALDPLTGRVLAVGLLVFGPNEEEAFHEVAIDPRGEDATEARILLSFWDVFARSIAGERTFFVGHNSTDFDLPFLVTRSRVLGVKVPSAVLKRSGNRYSFSERFVDTRTVFALGRDVRSMKTSLGHLCRLLGLGEKSGDGADFAGLLASGRLDEARDYLKKDLSLTAHLANRLSVADLVGVFESLPKNLIDA